MTSLFHVGIAVKNLDATIQILQNYFEFELLSRRRVEHEYIGHLIGSNQVSADIAMLDIGDGSLIELIRWGDSKEPAILEKEYELSCSGVQHLCIYVDSADEWFAKLEKVSGIKLLSRSPLEVPFGPNKGCRVFFASVLAELHIEIFQRVT